MAFHINGDSRPVHFDDALERTGNGLYNVLLVATCSIILLAVGMDMFGLSLVVSAACDLNLTVTQKGILTSLPFIGIFLVSYPWGYFSDTKGRRCTLVMPLLTAFVLTCFASFSPNWIYLGAFKFLAYCFACAANSVTYTLFGESCIERVRSRYLVLMTSLLLLSSGVSALVTYPILKLDFAFDIPWLGIVYRPWRLLMVAQSAPLGIGAIAMYFFHESPKFLYNSGRKDEALDVLKYIYKVNNRRSNTEFPVQSLKFEEQPEKKKMSVLRAMYEQSAPIFRAPFLWRSVQLFYIVSVVFITNNSLIVWLPHILDMVMSMMDGTTTITGNVCQIINAEDVISSERHIEVTNTTTIEQVLCESAVKENVILTIMVSQSIFAFLNFLISYFPNRRRLIVIVNLVASAISALCLNLVPHPIVSTLFYVVFSCTCLTMGVLASYFVDIYPTSCRGMAACLSIMIGRSSTFVGVNVVGSLFFSYCEITFYAWSLLVLISAIAAWYLPRDNPVESSKL